MNEKIGDCRYREKKSGVCNSLQILAGSYALSSLRTLAGMQITDIRCGLPKTNNRSCPIAKYEAGLMASGPALNLYNIAIAVASTLAQPSAELNQVS